MWFLLALSCAVVVAQPRDLWDPFTPRRQQNFGNPAFADPVGPLYPDGPKKQAQDPDYGAPFGQDPAFPAQTGGYRRYESEFRPVFGVNQDLQKNEQWQKWGGSGKAQRNGRAGRPSYKPDWMPVRSTPAPAGGGRENQINPLFGKTLSPTMMDNRQFIPLFKADSVTVQNVSALHLKEGENVFLLPKGRGQMQPPKKGGANRPQELGYGQGFSLYGPQPYMKIFYNPTATQKISFEYGITQLFPAFMKAEAGK